MQRGQISVIDEGHVGPDALVWAGEQSPLTRPRWARLGCVTRPYVLPDKQMDYEINPAEVKAELDRGESFILLDVREPWEFEASSIAGSKHIPMGDVPSRAHLELDPEEHIVVVCHHGVRSMSVTNWLRQQGFENAQSMRGGIDAWSRQVDSKTPLY